MTIGSYGDARQLDFLPVKCTHDSQDRNVQYFSQLRGDHPNHCSNDTNFTAVTPQTDEP